MPQYDYKGKNFYVRNSDDSKVCIKTVINFLHIFVPDTTARKLVCVILIAIGMPVSQIAELVELSERSVRSAGQAVKDGSIGSVLIHKKASGRKSKTADVEDQIFAELENGNYHTRQQIADMIKEKFQITVSRPAVGRLLKSRIQKIEMRATQEEASGVEYTKSL